MKALVVICLVAFCFMMIEEVEMKCWAFCRVRITINIGKRSAKKLPMTEDPCLFDNFDTDGDGGITKLEFQKEAIDFGTIKPHAMTMFVVMDENDDAKVTRQEFEKAIPVLLEAKAIDKCGAKKQIPKGSKGN